MNRITGSIPHITTATMLAAFMAFVDISIINVALENIRSTFGVSLEQAGWVTTSYMIANVVVMPLSGWLQRQFGMRAYFAGSAALFTFASALCGMAQSFGMFIFFRIVQGIGGGALIPTSQSLLLDVYPKEQHDRASALFGVGALAGPVLGPSLGGWLLDSVSWPWLFFINVPFGIIVVVLAWNHIRELNRLERRGPDILGFVLLALGLGSIQYVLEEGNRLDWLQSRRVIFFTLLGAGATVSFIIHALHTKRPLIDLRLFHDHRFRGGAILNTALGALMIGGAYLLSLFCGDVLGYPPKEIGWVLLFGNAIDFVIVPLVAWQLKRFELRVYLLLGTGLLALSAVMAARLGTNLDFIDLVLPQIVRSVGAGLIYIPVTIAALQHLDEQKRATAVGLFNVMRELGGSMGTALLGYAVTQRQRLHYAHLADHVTPFRWEFAAEMHRYGWTHGMARATGLSAADAILSRLAQVQASVLAFNDAYLILFVLMLCTIPFIAVLKGRVEVT